MKLLFQAFGLWSVVAAAFLASFGAQLVPSAAAQTRSECKAQSEEICAVVRRVSTLREVSDLLRREASAPTPRNLSTAELDEAKSYSAWLYQTADRLDALAQVGDAAISTGVLTEMSQTFTMQYLAIQQKLQQETREFNLISNIMKTKHEAAKNAVNNIR